MFYRSRVLALAALRQDGFTIYQTSGPGQTILKCTLHEVCNVLGTSGHKSGARMRLSDLSIAEKGVKKGPNGEMVRPTP